MSEYSPGPVGQTETVARFIFTPMHLGRNGNLKPSVFSHIFNRGCSIQRESCATDDELRTFVHNFLSCDSTRTWKGVIEAPVQSLRKLCVADEHRAVCVYDTAEKQNRAHGEICCSRTLDEADQAELRRKLFEVFTGLIKPVDYRGGRVLAALPQDLQNRT